MNNASSLVLLRDWDTEFFGFPIARIEAGFYNLEVARQVEVLTADWPQLRLLEFLGASSDLASLRAAESSGFQLADIRMTFGKQIKESGAASLVPHRWCFSTATMADFPLLKVRSTGMYEETRYSCDPHFPADRARALYHEWLKKAIEGTFDHFCYVLRSIDQTPEAFCTIRALDPQTASIGLFGVAAPFRGQGLGSYLLREVENLLGRQGITHLRVVTQGRNTIAQRLYQRAGFLTEEVHLWYHKWFDI